MQALLWGILNTHVNALCVCAAFTRLAVLVVQVGAAWQAGLLYGSGRCMIRQWLEEAVPVVPRTGAGQSGGHRDCPGRFFQCAVPLAVWAQ